MQHLHLLHSLRFYITDLSEKLQLNFNELNRTQQNVFKLYRAVQLTQDELTDYQNNIGHLISNTEFLLTSSEYSIAYDLMKQSTKQEGFAHAIIEYIVDLNVAKNTIIGDVRPYSPSLGQVSFLIDMGKKKMTKILFI